MTLVKLFGCAALVIFMVGCGSVPESQYYTLSPSTSTAATTAASPYAMSQGAFAISVQPVALPDQVDRPQIVLSNQKDAEVTLLNGSLWASPLSDEIRNALANDLSAQLGVINIPLHSVPPTLPLWVVDLTVQRFDSVYNQWALLDTTWRLAPRNQTKKSITICHASVRVSVGQGMPALIGGHQQALHQVATAIAAQLSGQSLSPSNDQIRLKGCNRG